MQIRDIAPSFVISTITAVVIYFFKFLPISNWVILPIQMTVGLGLFALLCKVTNNKEIKEVIGLSKSLLKNKRNNEVS